MVIGGRGQEFCDGRAMALVMKSVTMGWGLKIVHNYVTSFMKNSLLKLCKCKFSMLFVSIPYHGSSEKSVFSLACLKRMLSNFPDYYMKRVSFSPAPSEINCPGHQIFLSKKTSRAFFGLCQQGRQIFCSNVVLKIDSENKVENIT